MNEPKSKRIGVIGAGPSGVIAALQLVAFGYEVDLFEKTKFPRFVIGESLLPACMNVLEDLDLIDTIKSKGHQVKTGASFCKGNETCEFSFEDQFSKSHSWTWQVKRKDFDQDLVNVAIDRGVNVFFEHEIFDFKYSNEATLKVRSAEGVKELNYEFILDASGYGRVLPKLLNLEDEVTLPERGAVYSHIQDVNRTKKNGENIFVHSFNNNKDWIWVIPFNDNSASIGVVGDLSTIESINSNAEFLKFFQEFQDLNNRFENQNLLLDVDWKVAYSVKSKQNYGDGYVLCGNATEFIDPVFSSGATFAMISGQLAAKLLHEQLSGREVDWKTEYDDYLQEGLKVFKDFIEMWYDGTFQRIVFAKYQVDSFKEQICSVLAGYVWDKNNPFVSKREKVMKSLMKVISFAEQEKI